MAESNVTGDSPFCPPASTEWQPWIRSFGLVGFVAITIYYVATLAWWYARRAQPWLAKRNFPLVVVSAIGGFLQVVLTWLGPYIGRNNLSCDLFLWFAFMVVPLSAGPLAVRLVLFRNTTMFTQALVQDHRTGTGTSLRRYENKSQWRAIKPMLSYQFTLGRRSQEAATPAEIAPASQVTDASDGSEVGIVRALYLGTTKRFGFAIEFVFLLVGLISILTKYTSTSPFGKGCTGCHITDADLAQFSVMTGLVVLIGVYMLWKVRHEPDPLGIVRELRICMVCGFLAVVGVVITISDPGSVREDGTFDHMWLVTLCILSFHTVQVPAQVLMTHESGRRLWARLFGRSMQRDFTLQELLDSSAGSTVFERYLATEFSVENLYFLNAVQNFKAHFSDDGQTVERNKESAMELFRIFLKEKAMLEVNVGARVRRKAKVMLVTDQIRPDMFDAAVAEVRTILETDSFPRFLSSTLFRDWDKSPLVAKAGTVAKSAQPSKLGSVV